QLSFVHTYTAPSGLQVPTIYPTLGTEEAKQKIWDQAPGYSQPRIGIAYRPWTDWVIRTGAGRFTSAQHMVQTSGASLAPPLASPYQFNNLTVPVAGSTTRMFSPGSPIYTLDAPFGANQTLGPQMVYTFQQDRKERDVWQWNFDIQHRLPADVVLDIGYVGSKTTHSTNN